MAPNPQETQMNTRSVKSEVKARPRELQNIESKKYVYETLSSKATVEALCTRKVCNGALMLPKKTLPKARPKDEVLEGAKKFIDEYYTSIKKFNSLDHKTRMEFISSSVLESGTYNLTGDELAFGTKLAWRNAPRCIGRIQWSNLNLFDARHVTTPREMFEAICTQLKYASNGGNIRSAITVFPSRTDPEKDFRVWNGTIISYAGYRQADGSIIGDPHTAEFTEICQSLGWKGKGGRWDILPLVLSANGEDPEFFDIPEELVIIVPITHPEYKIFEEMGLQWFAVPGVSNMAFDCGGLEFPACPFNGWYMSTEIATRDLCDPHRYNVLEDVALGMGLDTRNPTTLWKDKANIEMNIAVLQSFQAHKVTIMDHHSASESFMKHFANEQKLRGGCPADWVWIIPPISGSLCPVFHQEMSLYHLKPSYEYMDPAWKTHIWKKEINGHMTNNKKSLRNYRFKEIAWAVMFASELYMKAVSKRTKATILYASETGKSETFAKKLEETFNRSFNAQVHCMVDYDITNIEKETLLLIVTSTFGNGDPPGNGKEFSKNLTALKSATPTDTSITAKKLTEKNKAVENGVPKNSISSLNDIINSGNYVAVGPLKNVRYAVFALGSTAFPKYCAFGKYLDKLLGELGGESIMDMKDGDEKDGQEESFKQWSKDVFKVSRETFGINEAAVNLATPTLNVVAAATAGSLKLQQVAKADERTLGLSQIHGQNIKTGQVMASRNLHGDNASRCTQQVIIGTGSDPELSYVPGDHVAIIPANPSTLVDAVLTRLSGCPNPDLPVQVMVEKKIATPTGSVSTWEPHERLPAASVREMLTNYLDLTTPPTPKFLHMLIEFAKDYEQKKNLDIFSREQQEYEKTKHFYYPNVNEVLEHYSSVTVDVCMFLTHLPLLQPRYYSISSSPSTYPGQIHLTVGVVEYRTQGGKGPLHQGTASSFLKSLRPGDNVECFVRSARNFHMPSDTGLPIIMVGSGTGVAPFRGFWLQRFYDINNKKEAPGEMTLFFGCQTRTLDLYSAEKEVMELAGVLSHTHLALSREPNIPKTYVQDLLLKAGADIYRQLVKENGHCYICGDSDKGEAAYQILKSIVKEHGKLSDEEVEKYMVQMKDENRYHEDIFGIPFKPNVDQQPKKLKVGMGSIMKKILGNMFTRKKSEGFLPNRSNSSVNLSNRSISSVNLSKRNISSVNLSK